MVPTARAPVPTNRQSFMARSSRFENATEGAQISFSIEKSCLTGSFVGLWPMGGKPYREGL